ncbi:hypothetical protein BS17DRAFT_809778 [Gyrodon lividus]|nr:hypothetical protein BS17DRAFT_809778 [Gyrodon lividus]
MTMSRTPLSLGLVGTTLATPTALLPRQLPGFDVSCLSLRNSCNPTTADLATFTNSRRARRALRILRRSGGNPLMSQQSYIDTYYHAISVTPGGTYPDKTGWNIPWSLYCIAILQCQPSQPALRQPITDNDSCAEMVRQCQLWVTGGLLQNEYRVLLIALRFYGDRQLEEKACHRIAGVKSPSLKFYLCLVWGLGTSY